MTDLRALLSWVHQALPILAPLATLVWLLVALRREIAAHRAQLARSEDE